MGAAQSAAGDGEVAAGGAASPLRGIVIERHDVFDLTQSSAWYERLMNALHVTTHESVIRRELLLHPGAPYDSARAAETARNLRKLNVFRDVQVDSAGTDSALGARVVTGDAFTLKPYVSLKTSGGQAAYGIGVVEQNLFGRLIGVEVKFKHEPDRDTLRFGVNAPRLIASRVGLSASYASLSDGKQANASVGMPFFSLASRASAQVSGEVIEGRLLRYLEGAPDPSDSLQRRYAVGRAQLGLATSSSDQGYLRLQLEGQVRRDDFAADQAPGPFPHTVTAAVSLFAEARRAKYVVTRNYRNIGPEEDVDLSTRVRVGASFAPRAWGYERNGVGPSLEFLTGMPLPRGFAFLNARASTLYNSAGLDSGTFIVTGTTVIHPANRHMALLFLGAGREENPFPGEEFDLGLVRGPRAFPQHAFTGDRMVFGSAEYRWTAIPELMKLIGVGVAAFVDHGGAWYGGSSRRTGTDAGLGLRIGSARFPSINGAARADIAYRFANDVEQGGWVLVLGTGFVFERGR
jgi:outer membrane translocation and assembly module TamA